MLWVLAEDPNAVFYLRVIQRVVESRQSSKQTNQDNPIQGKMQTTRQRNETHNAGAQTWRGNKKMRLKEFVKRHHLNKPDPTR